MVYTQRMRLVLGLSVVVGVAALSSALFLACGSPTVTPVPDAGGGTFILPPDGGRVDGLSNTLRDGGIRPDRPPSSCRKLGPEIQLTTAPAGATVPTLRWTGQGYLVAYSEREAAADTYVIALGPDGMPTAAATPLEVTPDASRVPSMVSFGAGWVVAWEELGTPKTIRARTLDAAGIPSSPVVTIASFASAEARPILSVSPVGLTLAYMDVVDGHPASKIVALDANLSIKSDPAPRILGAPGMTTSHPYTYGDSTSLAAVYTRVTESGQDVEFVLFDSVMNVVKETQLRTGPTDGILGRLIRTNFGFLATWEDARTGENEIYSARVSPSGDLLGSSLIQEDNSGDGNWSNMAWHDDVGGVAFYQFRYGKPNVFLSFIDEQGQRVGGRSDFQVSDKPAEFSSRFPDIVWNGTDFALVWADGRTGVYQTFFARVDCQK